MKYACGGENDETSGEKRAVAAEEEMANIHEKLMSVLNKSAVSAAIPL